MPIDINELKSFCQNFQDNDQYGGFVNPDTAKKGRAIWNKKRNGSSVPTDEDIVAVSFGKKKLLELLALYDQKYATWKGARLYFVRSTDTIPGLGKVEHDDVIIVPYGPDNKDMIDVKQDSTTPDDTPIEHLTPADIAAGATVTSGDVFNTSRPCPNYCQ